MNNVLPGHIYGNTGTTFLITPSAIPLIVHLLELYNYVTSQSFNYSTYPVSR